MSEANQKFYLNLDLYKKKLEKVSEEKNETQINLNFKIKELEQALATNYAEIAQLNISVQELGSKNFKTAEKLKNSNEELKLLLNDAAIVHESSKRGQKRPKKSSLENESEGTKSKLPNSNVIFILIF